MMTKTFGLARALQVTIVKLYGDQLEMNALLAECAHLTTYQSNFLHYRPQRSWGKVMFLHVCVILFTGGWSVCLSACWDTTTPQQGDPHPPARQTPPWQGDPPLAKRLPGKETPLARRPPTGKETPTPPAKRPPLARRPRGTMHAGRYGQQVGGLHPTGMQFLFSYMFLRKIRLNNTLLSSL